MLRITHTDDGVPQTIAQDQGYRHHATEFWELEPFEADETFQCEGDEDPVSLPSSGSFRLIDGLAKAMGIDMQRLHGWCGDWDEWKGD